MDSYTGQFRCRARFRGCRERCDDKSIADQIQHDVRLCTPECLGLPDDRKFHPNGAFPIAAPETDQKDQPVMKESWNPPFNMKRSCWRWLLCGTPDTTL